eukprot:GHVP01021674.1.p1 GENE.GHVP01021674.1~~GHVP01021674.1.p1  ORF type:complete len:219 (+),score=5.58 GHVP01021674.1:15-671(+)
MDDTIKMISKNHINSIYLSILFSITLNIILFIATASILSVIKPTCENTLFTFIFVLLAGTNIMLWMLFFFRTEEKYVFRWILVVLFSISLCFLSLVYGFNLKEVFQNVFFIYACHLLCVKILLILALKLCTLKRRFNICFYTLFIISSSSYILIVCLFTKGALFEAIFAFNSLLVYHACIKMISDHILEYEKHKGNYNPNQKYRGEETSKPFTGSGMI